MALKRYETLNATHVINANTDRVYVAEYNSWEKIDPKLHGLMYEASSYPPMRREFTIVGKEKVEYPEKKKEDKKKFDLRKLKEPKKILIRYGGKQLAVDFHPTRFAPSKEFIYMSFYGGDGGFFGEWVSTNDLENWIIEYLKQQQLRRLQRRRKLLGQRLSNSFSSFRRCRKQSIE